MIKLNKHNGGFLLICRVVVVVVAVDAGADDECEGGELGKSSVGPFIHSATTDDACDDGKYDVLVMGKGLI